MKVEYMDYVVLTNILLHINIESLRINTQIESVHRKICLSLK